MIICHLQYQLDPARLADFAEYAKSWMAIIERLGGTHHGYFVSNPTQAPLSFPGLGTEGPANVGFAFFSFPDQAAYDAYRRLAAEDPEAMAATERFRARPSFTES